LVRTQKASTCTNIEIPAIYEVSRKRNMKTHKKGQNGKKQITDDDLTIERQDRD